MSANLKIRDNIKAAKFCSFVQGDIDTVLVELCNDGEDTGENDDKKKNQAKKDFILDDISDPKLMVKFK